VSNRKPAGDGRLASVVITPRFKPNPYSGGLAC
jgi:hypothetical protein